MFDFAYQLKVWDPASRMYADVTQEYDESYFVPVAVYESCDQNDPRWFREEIEQLPVANCLDLDYPVFCDVTEKLRK